MSTRVRSRLLALLLVVGLPAAAAGPTDDALRLVPPGAAAAGMLRISDLRSSPLAPRLFSDMDHMTADGDAARFLAETGLRPVEDVDLIMFAASPGAGGKGRGDVLVAVEGRFDPAKLSAAAVSRGATVRTAPPGGYLLLPSKGKDDGPGAVSFVSRHLVLVGSEAAVVDALAARVSGGTGLPASSAGLGRPFSKVETGASGWVVVDRSRFPQASGMHVKSEDGNAAGAIVAAMNQVSSFVFQMTAQGEALKLTATGLSSDEETRALLEDAVRGLLAAFRLSSQDKPDVVSVLRKFKVTRDGDGVSVSGTLPAEVIRTLAEKRRQR